MSSVLFARNERHTLMGLLLKVRVLVYVLLGVPLVASADIEPELQILCLVFIALVAAAPYVARSSGRYSGVRLSASIDLIVSYVVWYLVPVAAPLTLVVTIWTVAVVVFLSPPSTARRFVVVAVILELTKVVVVFGAPNALGRDTTDLGWFTLGRASLIAGAYYVLRSLDEYFSRLYAASESGSDRYRRLMDAAPTAFVVAADGSITYANEAAARLLGGGDGNVLLGADLTAFVEADARPELTDRMRRAEELLDTFDIKGLEMVTTAGESLYVDAAITAVDFSHGLAVQVALHDVSAQRLAESELLETKLNYRSFFERIPVALYRSRPNGEIIQANRALVELLGAHGENELIGRNARDFYADSGDREHLTSMLSEQRIVVGYESRMRRLDGALVWVRDTSRLIDTDIGQVYEGAMVDVTGRHNIEDELWSRAMQQEAAASIGQTALEADDINTVMRSVAETVARVLRTDGCVILHRTLSTTFVTIGQSSGVDVDASAIAGLADRAHMTAAPVVLRNASELAFAAPELHDGGIDSAMAVMIPGADMDFGTLAVLSRDERIFTSDDLNFLHSVANVLAAAVDRATAKARLEELLRSKDSFVASVSHELRTPLTVVTGMAHELNERWMDLSDSELAEFTRLLVEQSQDMSDLIEDLLVAARANIGNVAVRNEPIELDRQIENVLAGFANVGSVDIRVKLEPGIVDADPIRVRQIVRNLITNAIRYGGRNVSVEMGSTAGARFVDVADDGPGIPVEDRERIFEAYERAHHTAGQPGSVGLGLTVSRTLAELMGGSLTYRFVDRSVFRLELSRDVAMEKQRRDAVPGGSVSTPSGVGLSRIGIDVGVVD